MVQPVPFLKQMCVYYFLTKQHKNAILFLESFYKSKYKEEMEVRLYDMESV